LKILQNKSFLQEFKRIRKEIQNEIKKEDMKYKSRIGTACTSPKNFTNSMVVKRSNENLHMENNIEIEGKR